jgi:hypothetical protein
MDALPGSNVPHACVRDIPATRDYNVTARTIDFHGQNTKKKLGLKKQEN